MSKFLGGSCSNPKAQVVAIESGMMQKLIRMLSIEESVAVRSRVLSALSSLIRSFPFAQQKFLELGGLDSLSLLIKRPEVSEKLSVKAVTLVNDLLVEQVGCCIGISTTTTTSNGRIYYPIFPK